MKDEINYDEIECEDILRKIAGVLARHVSNLDNTMAMMRSGQFIDAYNRLTGTKEGINHIRVVVSEKLQSIDSKNGSQNENNTN